MSNNNMISDEQLSAFLDGNTSKEDTLRVLKAADEELRKITQIANEVDHDVTKQEFAVSNIPMTAMAAKQKDNYLCDIECEEFVLHQFGIEITHKSLLDEAYRNCWLKEKGMPLYNIGRLLEKNNLSVSRRYNSTLEDIKRLLEAGNQLIAVLDNAILDGIDNSDEDKALPNHAVTISSLSTDEEEITLFNPTTEEELTTYKAALFLQAWQQSNNYLVVVNTTDKFVYEPSPISLDDVILSDDLAELQEAIAENAHEIWAKARTDQGWTYGPERNDAQKELPT